MSDQWILIVDDVELNRAILAELFNRQYEVLEVENGLLALEALRQYGDSIAMVLLDLVMPVMDGLQVLRAMNSSGQIRRIPVILITAELNDAAMLESYTLGVSDMIAKPFNPDIVRRRVQNIIELFSGKQHLEREVDKQMKQLALQEQKLERANMFLIDTLSTVVEFRNSESGTHIKRIREITHSLLCTLAEKYPEYRLDVGTIQTISNAAAMHDIGKIAIPDAILLKPSRLTREEYAVMKTHTVRGCEILESLDYAQGEEYYRYCYEICRHHHERWDGHGYPDGLIGDSIPLCAQVVALADVYDALTSERVYKQAYSHEEAVSIIVRGECGMFGPRLLERFVVIADSLRCAEAERPESAPHHRQAATILCDPAADTLVRRQDRALWLLEREQEKHRILAEISNEVLFDYDAKTDYMRFSEKFWDVFGHSGAYPEFTLALKNSDRISSEDRDLIAQTLAGLTPECPHCRLEVQIRTLFGKFEWFEVYTYALWDLGIEYCVCVGYYGKITNIHSRKRETAALRQRADIDPLTGLYNRQMLKEQVTQYLECASAAPAALLFIDVDNFKTINDSFGHLFGDAVLQQIGSGIQAVLRRTDYIGRVGGDEFIVFMQNVFNSPVLEQKARAICEVFRRRIEHHGREILLSGSVGIACYPEHGGSYEELLAKADQALYRAKGDGKNTFCVFSGVSGDGNE